MVEISSEICFSWIVAGFYTFRNSTAYLAFMDSISVSLSEFGNRNGYIVYKRSDSKEYIANSFITGSYFTD